jgi:type IV pilus assembly protein PilC
MFEEFELELPAATQLLITLSDGVVWFSSGPGMWVAFGGFFVLVAIIVAASLGIGTAWTQRFAATIPLVGPMWQWSGAAAFSRLLAMMLEQEIQLGKAIEMAADGVNDPDVRQTAAVLARNVENGRALSDALWQDGRLPTTMAPFVKWGEKSGELSDGLRAISEILLLRVSMRASLMRAVSPPVVFLFVGMIIGFVIIALFMPLVSLIQGLT